MSFKNLIILFFMMANIMFIGDSKGRSPAVDPVSSISIDEYQDVEPEQAKGFDFNSTTPSSAAPSATPKAQDSNFFPNLKVEESMTSFSASIIFFLGIAISFFFAYRILKDSKSTMNSMQTHEAPTLDEGDNIHILEQHRKEVEQLKDRSDDDVRKAS